MSWLDELKDKYKDDRFFREIIEKQEYKAALDQGQVDTVLDIGALAGEFSFYIYDHAKKIYALEPEIGAYVELKDNISEHKLNKIKAFHLALSDKNGIGYLQVDGRGANTMSGEASDKTVSVPTITLNTFLEENSIESVDILKIDIESHENAVFQSPDIDKAMAKVKFMIGEHGNLDLVRDFGFEVKQEGGIWTATKI